MKSGQMKETTGLVIAQKGHTSESQPTLVSKPTGAGRKIASSRKTLWDKWYGWEWQGQGYTCVCFFLI